MAQHASAHPGDAADPGLERAFETLFLREYARVVAIARRVLGGGDEAADVAQDVFLSALTRGVAHGPRPAAWLYAAAVHTALNHQRAGRRRSERQRRHALSRIAPGAPAEAPDAAVEAAAERRALRRLLARLPERQAAILVLRHSGLSYAEVAQTLGLSPGSVGTLLRRAEAALRKEWERHAPQ